MDVLQSHVQANLYGMGRDPTYFPEPQRYLPDRWVRDAEDDATSWERSSNLLSASVSGTEPGCASVSAKAYYFSLCHQCLHHSSYAMTYLIIINWHNVLCKTYTNIIICTLRPLLILYALNIVGSDI